MRHKAYLTSFLILFMVTLFISALLSAQEQRQRDMSERHERWKQRKAERDLIFEELSKGVLDYEKVVYKSREGYIDIPAYIFSPVEKNNAAGYPALIWIHGGVHGDLDNRYFPFIQEAVERGYVVICPEYRGSTGYGEEHYDAIDYGGYEVDDCISAVDYMKRHKRFVDTERVALIGWSHGGFITLHGITRNPELFKCGVAIVPVTNLIFRLAYKGPRYQSFYTSQERIGGNTWERREIYKQRSPVYQVDRLELPVLVHLAENDTDVNFEEAEMLVNALKVKKPDLAEIRIYKNPEGGHSFNRLADTETLKPVLTPELRDSWNRIWTFLEWHLRPYEGK